VLHEASCARAVVCSAANGRILTHTGEDNWEALLRGFFEPHAKGRLPKQPATKSTKLPEVWEIGEGVVLYTARFRAGLLVVKFHQEEPALGLVRLRAARAIEELEELLREDDAPAGPPPASGRGGPGGIPAQVSVAEVEPRPKQKR